MDNNENKPKERVFCRKLRLLPESIEPKTWVSYLESCIRQEEINKKKLENCKKEKTKENDIEEINKKISDLKNQLEEIKNKIKNKEPIEFTRKQISEATYKFVNDCLYAFYKAMNLCNTNYYVAEVLGVDEDGKKELHRTLSREVDSKLGSAYNVDNKEMQKIFGDSYKRMATAKYRENLQFPTGISIGASAERKSTQLFKSKYKDIMSGECALPTYKKGNPFVVKGNILRKTSKNGSGFYHTYEDEIDLENALRNNSNLDIYLKFVNGITFKVHTGTIARNEGLKSTILRMFDGTYKICDSSMYIDERHNNIMLNLTLKMKIEELKLDPETVVGVDLGLAVPATVALNNNDSIAKSIGKEFDLLHKRTQLSNQRKRVMSSLKTVKGGHGRKKKLKALMKYKDKERNFVNTYNHMISKEVVDFAVKNKAGQINIENISGFGLIDEDENKKRVLRYWSYYELQQMIKDKASKYGIVVKMVNPCYTSQICSICGHFEFGQRESQSEFVCKNKNCKSHKMKYENADKNAARNIAKCDLYDDKTYKKAEDKEEMILKAREHWKITKYFNDENNEEKKVV